MLTFLYFIITKLGNWRQFFWAHLILVLLPYFRVNLSFNSLYLHHEFLFIFCIQFPHLIRTIYFSPNCIRLMMLENNLFSIASINKFDPGNRLHKSLFTCIYMTMSILQLSLSSAWISSSSTMYHVYLFMTYFPACSDALLVDTYVLKLTFVDSYSKTQLDE